MFKQLGDFASLMRSAGELQKKMEAITEEMKSKTVTGSAGGGFVEVTANGTGRIVSVKIDPTLVQSGDREMIEDLLPAAINQALEKAQTLYADEMSAVAGNLPLGGLGEMMSKYMK